MFNERKDSWVVRAPHVLTHTENFTFQPSSGYCLLILCIRNHCGIINFNSEVCGYDFLKSVNGILKRRHIKIQDIIVFSIILFQSS